MSSLILVDADVFTSAELSLYEQEILDDPHATEHEASRFFERFPKFLSIGGYKILAREVILYKPNGEVAFRVDFCRRQFGEELWDFVELKSPKTPFLVKRGGHWKFSAGIQTGIEQAQDYRDFLDDIANKNGARETWAHYRIPTQTPRRWR